MKLPGYYKWDGTTLESGNPPFSDPGTVFLCEETTNLHFGSYFCIKGIPGIDYWLVVVTDSIHFEEDHSEFNNKLDDLLGDSND